MVRNAARLMAVIVMSLMFVAPVWAKKPPEPEDIPVLSPEAEQKIKQSAAEREARQAEIEARREAASRNKDRGQTPRQRNR